MRRLALLVSAVSLLTILYAPHALGWVSGVSRFEQRIAPKECINTFTDTGGSITHESTCVISVSTDDKDIPLSEPLQASPEELPEAESEEKEDARIAKKFVANQNEEDSTVSEEDNIRRVLVTLAVLIMASVATLLFVVISNNR